MLDADYQFMDADISRRVLEYDLYHRPPGEPFNLKDIADAFWDEYFNPKP
jgi:hypothetical protein